MARPSPPPLKRNPTTPASPRDDDDDVDVTADVGPEAPSDDDDATKGEWLFKKDDLVLGPVTAIVLVERIKAGDLSADTPIARDGQPFKPMKLVPLFRQAHQSVLEQARLEAEERAYQGAVRRARLARVVLFVGLVAVPLAAGAAAGRVTLERLKDENGEWTFDEERLVVWVQKAPPLVDLPPQPKAEPKVAALSPPPAAEEDEEEDEPDSRDPKNRGKKKKTKKSAGGDKVATAAGAAEPADAKAEAEDKPSGPVQETLTNEQAIAPLKTIQGDLKGCFKAEMDSNPDMPTEVRLSYTVTEEGKATNVSLENRELRGRPVVDCVRKAVGKGKWPRFTGERKNVTVPFRFNKPKTGTPPK